ncbi:hypothetical protein MKW98_023905 [Papaver atlanticum]|uniref:Uncharacterized protein n=1 Tax=Papaver atlanticum TaxID=357466 RepID=A0AAD4SZL5_9MAGN|nr:hypothetical protein MKW98_023905 [Papaver atlanticum]
MGEKQLRSNKSQSKVQEEIKRNNYNRTPTNTNKQEDFEKSAAGRASKAQMTAMAKQSAAPKTGEPVLKWQMG